MEYKRIYISWRSVRNFSMIYGKVSVSWRPRKKISMVIHKSSYIMEACKEFFHDIQRNLYTMEFRKVTFHDIRINFHIMEYLKKPFHDTRRKFHTMEIREKPFHDIRVNSYIMELGVDALEDKGLERAHENITVSELAESVGLNETYLSKLFKKEMGCTVSEYIRDEKIEEACYLLSFTNKTSIEIATDLSFSSHSYFISVFKKVKGVTPKEYRNQHKAI